MQRSWNSSLGYPMMTSSPKSPCKTRAERVLAQVDEFGLTTRTFVAEEFANGNRVKARDLLRRLEKSRDLFRHIYEEGDQQFVYYTRRQHGTNPKHLRRDFATLWFCRSEASRLRLLTPDAISQLLSKVGNSSTEMQQRFLRSVFFQVQEEPVPRIALIRIHGQFDTGRLDLNRAVSGIDRFVSAPRFGLWHRLATLGRFLLIYLVAGEQNTLELATWLRRRPPVSRVAIPAVPIDVMVFRAEPLHMGYVQKRQKTP